MSRAIQDAVPILTSLLLFTLTPQLLRAQAAYLEPKELTLSALTPSSGSPTIRSSAWVILKSTATGQPLVGQVILIHGVADTTTQQKIYEKRLVSETGEASETAYMTGIVSHCYDAAMEAYANAYSLHNQWGIGGVCAEPYVSDPAPKPDVPKENCPVLLDLQQDGFHLSGPDPAVRFDIDADGTPDEIAWTQAGEDDAFLCWDRDHNGVIDDGRELFGYSTPLVSGGPAKVGYRALAELDQAALGGNRDGKVDTGDRAFRELCAWVDTNRDGVSQSDEIHALDEVGVVTLSYAYQKIKLLDPYGNLFRYTSQAEMRSPSGEIHSWPTFDVIFGELQGAD